MEEYSSQLIKRGFDRKNSIADKPEIFTTTKKGENLVSTEKCEFSLKKYFCTETPFLVLYQ